MTGASERPVAILAGSGELPGRLAAQLAVQGRAHRVLAFRGFCEPGLARRADERVDLLDVKGALACLERWNPAAVTLAGGLTRPSPAVLAGAFSAFRNREELAAIVTRGDDNLLRGAIDLLERHGHVVIGVRDLAPEILATTGTYGRLEPDAARLRSIALGLRVLEALSPYDVGQAVAVAGEQVLAVEGPEGTDAMLARVRPRRWWGGRRSASDGVLVKAPKLGQDLRVDLPAIGPRTVARAAKAGLAGIAVASRLTLVLNRPATVAAADRAGLFVVGIEADATEYAHV